jgi:hypothetical protein
MRKNIIVGPVGTYDEVGSRGKREMASRIIDVVRSRENVLPASCSVSIDYCWRKTVLTLTPLARTGHPANNPTDRRTSANTWAVDGNLEARTTEAESALVSDKDEVRL